MSGVLETLADLGESQVIFAVCDPCGSLFCQMGGTLPTDESCSGQASHMECLYEDYEFVVGGCAGKLALRLRFRAAR